MGKRSGDEQQAGVLRGRRVAILATDGFDPSELGEPRRVLESAGASVHVVAPKGGTVRGHGDAGEAVAVQATLADANPDEYDLLFVPGGESPGQLRSEPRAIEFVRAFAHAEKPIGAICHGPLLLAEAEALRGRRCTSTPSIASTLRAAGALWQDEPVIDDLGIVTGRGPADLAAFSERLVDVFAQQSVAGRTNALPEG
jgi:protease I